MLQSLKQLTPEKKSFSNCELDSAFQTLTTTEKVIRLRGKLFYVLSCLVENQNQLVSRNKLINECWDGNEYTGEKAVTHTICQLRKLLKDLDIPMTITTLSKQGYVFTQLGIKPFKNLSKSNSNNSILSRSL